MSSLILHQYRTILLDKYDTTIDVIHFSRFTGLESI